MAVAEPTAVVAGIRILASGSPHLPRASTLQAPVRAVLRGHRSVDPPPCPGPSTHPRALSRGSRWQVFVSPTRKGVESLRAPAVRIREKTKIGDTPRRRFHPRRCPIAPRLHWSECLAFSRDVSELQCARFHLVRALVPSSRCRWIGRTCASVPSGGHFPVCPPAFVVSGKIPGRSIGGRPNACRELP